MEIIIKYKDNEVEVIEVESKEKIAYREERGIAHIFYDDELILTINLNEVQSVRYVG